MVDWVTDKWTQKFEESGGGNRLKDMALMAECKEAPEEYLDVAVSVEHSERPIWTRFFADQLIFWYQAKVIGKMPYHHPLLVVPSDFPGFEAIYSQMLIFDWIEQIFLELSEVACDIPGSHLH